MSNIIRTIAFMGMGFATQAIAGTFTLSLPLTDDASTQISSGKNYTHKVTGGAAATVNGVVFSILSSTVTPASFAWVSAGGKGQVVNNNNNWLPASGGVTGPGLLSLLGSLTYAPTGGNAGAFQSFTLSDLFVGTTYDTRLYIRAWDNLATSSGRPIDIAMTNGAESNAFSISEDKPGTVLGTGNVNQAYYINYRFTAQTTSLVINAAVPAGASLDSGSFHVYGLTNEVVPEPGSAMAALLAAGVFAARRRRK